MGSVAQAPQRGRPRSPHRVVLAAGQVHRRAPRGRAAVDRRPGRPRQLGHSRADRRPRALRPRSGGQVRDVRHPADPRCDLRRVAPARLGASLGADQGAGHPTGDGELRGDERTLAERRGAGGRAGRRAGRARPVARLGGEHHDRSPRAGPRRRRRADGVVRRGADRAVEAGRGVGGAGCGSRRDRQAARSREARAVAVLRRRAHARPDRTCASASARAVCPSCTRSRCCTCGPASRRPDWPERRSTLLPRRAEEVRMRRRRRRSPRPPGAFIADTAVAFGAALALLVAAPAAAEAGPCLAPPVVAPISRPFSAPPCRWCAGHRGVTFTVTAGTVVRAMAPGTVTFSGIVVDVRYVVVRHGDGLLATYGGLASSPLAAGDRVAEGAVVGRAGGDLYVGLRTGPGSLHRPRAADRCAGGAAVPRAHRRHAGAPAARPGAALRAVSRARRPAVRLRPVTARPARCATSRSERRRGGGGSAPTRSRRRRSWR